MASASEAFEQSKKELEENFKILFPKKEVDCVSFPFPFRETHIEKANNYILGFSNPFILGDIYNPKKTIKLLENKKVKGLKVYYDFVKKDYKDIIISDFLPEVFLEKLNSLKKPLMLHVPGSSINEAKNISELIRISKDFPNLKIILAHIGRCSTKKDLVESLSTIKNLTNIVLDTSTITSAEAFEEAIKIFGVNRILYGSDSPYSNTNGRIINVPGKIKNPFITQKVFPWTLPYLRKWYLQNKPELTFLVYHQLDAMRKASKKLRLGKEDIERIFYKNAKKLLAR